MCYSCMVYLYIYVRFISTLKSGSEGLDSMMLLAICSDPLPLSALRRLGVHHGFSIIGVLVKVGFITSSA